MDIMEVMCEEIDEEVNNDIEDYHEAEMEETCRRVLTGRTWRTPRLSLR